MRRMSINRRSDREAGFSLVEMLVVLAILALVAAVTFPVALRTPPGLEIRAAAADVAATLRFVRAEALSRGEDALFSIDVEKRHFWSDKSGRRIALPKGLAVTLTTALPERIGQDLGRIRFHGDGSSTGGRILLTDGIRTVTIEADWLTGRIDVSGP